MPIDLLAQRQAREQQLKNIVGGRDIGDELSRVRGGVESTRNRFLGRATNLISGASPVGRSSALARTGEIDPKINAILARRKLELQRQKYQAMFNNAFDTAIQYGLDEKSASDYARKFAEQSRLQEIEASESEKTRAYKKRLSAMASEFAGAGEALTNEFQPSTDYKSAILGSILGSVSNIALTKYLHRDQTEQDTPYQRQPDFLGTGRSYADLLRDQDFTPYNKPLRYQYGIHNFRG